MLKQIDVYNKKVIISDSNLTIGRNLGNSYM